jgi:hypothetical protein
METINFPRYPSDFEFRRFTRIWAKQTSVGVSFPKTLTQAEIQHVASLCFLNLPNEFSFFVLTNLAERKETPEAVLEEIFERGDTACRVAICLREYLHPNLQKRSSEFAAAEARAKLLAKKTPAEENAADAPSAGTPP